MEMTAASRIVRNQWLALFFCFNHHIANMQILGESVDVRMNFTFPVTDLRGD